MQQIKSCGLPDILKVLKLKQDLDYKSYKSQRIRSPEVEVEQWGKIYPNVQILELRYQKEKGAIK